LSSVDDKQLKKIAEECNGLAGAEIENVINLAALQSVRKAISSKQPNSSLTG
jgi:ATP-dependent Zn protease